MKDASYPPWICEPCGRRVGRPGATGTSTWHMPVPDDPREACGWCGTRTVALTEPRDYGYPRKP